MTDLFSENIRKWQAEGYNSYAAGLRLPDNPYKWGTQREQCVAWGRGWAWARTDTIRQNEGPRDG